ncbi:Urease accessory protein UreE [Zhongshania aliphaticivorans]|uniref:Urease accessory protein UreE n=1 Tax=Zhongshania aliphaticivorans TaxID=1470434 RepID=A0A5S9Q9E1_9GAMM|nr:urease accessory protein UreE [Zhongshania aliphaticivorans]CAA0103078.1 Urease accessory protein UreE [Zhongshania aliphaticivorans]CAA0113726.1 Urease accessory protein UreE [Zhongshania aliphaticivorans]
MLECYELGGGCSEIRLVLNYQERQRSRFRAKTLCGQDVAWFVERGKVLADGEVLIAKSGEKILVVAAEETVSEVRSNDPLLLAKAAYHLGNRHVPLQIEAEELRYQHDHVLDDMVRGLGLTVLVTDKTFHPENGAYHSSTGAHSHSHSHDHHHG